MDSILIFWSGFALGCWHALDADHLCTVSALLVERQPYRRALALALSWALGHSFTLLVLTAVFASLQTAFQIFPWAEQGIGGSMILLGLWILWRQNSNTTHSKNVLIGMGVLHGFAGSVSVFFLIPTVASQSFFLVMAYVVCFSLGMVLAIALYMFIFNCSLFIRNFDLKPVRFVTAFLTLFVGFRLLLA